jgi:hypothetical protein
MTGDDSQLTSPVLIIISIGLITYLVYLLSLMVLGSPLRVVENVILIIVIISAVVIVILIIREQTKVKERFNRIWFKIEELMIREKKEKDSKEEERVKEKLKQEVEALRKMHEKEKKSRAEKPEVIKEEKPRAVREEPEAEKPREEKKERIKKEVRLDMTRKEMPKVNKEKLEEISSLLKKGAELSKTDIKGAKEAFTRVRDIYDSMSSEEKRLIDEEIVKVTGKIVKKSRKKRG